MDPPHPPPRPTPPRPTPCGYLYGGQASRTSLARSILDAVGQMSYNMGNPIDEWPDGTH
jgi:hypothetical protein